MSRSLQILCEGLYFLCESGRGQCIGYIMSPCGIMTFDNLSHSTACVQYNPNDDDERHDGAWCGEYTER